MSSRSFTVVLQVRTMISTFENSTRSKPSTNSKSAKKLACEPSSVDHPTANECLLSSSNSPSRCLLVSFHCKTTNSSCTLTSVSPTRSHWSWSAYGAHAEPYSASWVLCHSISSAVGSLFLDPFGFNSLLPSPWSSVSLPIHPVLLADQN